MTKTNTAPLTKADLAELFSWAERVAEQASDWAERAEVSRGERKQLTTKLDSIASQAVNVASLTNVLVDR